MLKYALLLIAQDFAPWKINTARAVTQAVLTLPRPRVGYEAGAESCQPGWPEPVWTGLLGAVRCTHVTLDCLLPQSLVFAAQRCSLKDATGLMVGLSSSSGNVDLHPP